MNPKSTDQRHPRVVVIGGGYAGVLAANRLQRRADVTLINPRAAFVERIRLHQLVTGSSTATQDYADVLGTAVRLVVDAARHIDAASRTVHLDSGAALDYDYLIYAVGSTGAIPEGAPGASEFAYPLAELEQAQRLHARLADVPPGAPVVVVGGGLTGIEAAAEFAEAGRAVTLVCGQLAPSLAASGRRSVTRKLTALGVDVVAARVAAVSADAVTLDDGRVLVGGGCPDGACTTCVDGSDGCPCDAGGGCNAGLSCLAGRCAMPRR